MFRKMMYPDRAHHRRAGPVGLRRQHQPQSVHGR